MAAINNRDRLSQACLVALRLNGIGRAECGRVIAAHAGAGRWWRNQRVHQHGACQRYARCQQGYAHRACHTHGRSQRRARIRRGHHHGNAQDGAENLTATTTALRQGDKGDHGFLMHNDQRPVLAQNRLTIHDADGGLGKLHDAALVQPTANALPDAGREQIDVLVQVERIMMDGDLCHRLFLDVAVIIFDLPARHVQIVQALKHDPSALDGVQNAAAVDI